MVVDTVAGTANHPLMVYQAMVLAETKLVNHTAQAAAITET